MKVNSGEKEYILNENDKNAIHFLYSFYIARNGGVLKPTNIIAKAFKVESEEMKYARILGPAMGAMLNKLGITWTLYN